MSFTTDPMSIAVKTPTKAEYMRLPRAGERDPVFGLSRTVLNELILPCEGNDFRPPVRSVVLRKRGAQTGIRLIDLDSMRAYLANNVEPAFKAASGSVA